MKRALTIILVALISAAAFAQGPPDSTSLLSVKATASALNPGWPGSAVITLTVAPGWHVNSNKPSEDYLKPTLVSFHAAKGFKFGPPKYPAPQSTKLEFSDKPLSVFEGVAVVTVPITAAGSAKPGKVVLKGEVSFQPCNASSCFAPATKPFTLAVTVLPGAKKPPVPSKPKPTVAVADTSPKDNTSVTKAAPTNAPVIPTPAVVVRKPAQAPVTKPVTVAPVPIASATTAAAPQQAPPDPWSDALKTRGLPVFLVLLFVAGLALNLTPCVYPMIAVTMSVFGARAGETRGRMLGKAIVYVLGMATMYTSLGLVAALTGGLFGGVLQSVWVQLGIAVFLIAMALGMFGLFTLQLPPSLANKLGGSGRTGLIGLFLSGLVVGLFAAPCVGPVVLGLLVLVGSRHDVAFGAITFFTLALGLGAPYVVLALFTGLLGKLPRSGGWMETVKHFFGVVLMAVASRYVVLAFAKDYVDLVTPLALVLGGDYLGFIESHGGESARFANNKRGLAVLAISAGVFLAAVAWNGLNGPAPAREAGWTVYSDAAFQDARAAGKPIVLDFGASWCAACRELQAKTFPDPRVVDALTPFAKFRVDLDGVNRAQEPALRARWNVKGLPDIVFVNEAGQIVPAARVGGFLPPDQFLSKISAARQPKSASAAQASPVRTKIDGDNPHGPLADGNA